MTSVDISISLSLESISVKKNPEAVELLSLISMLPDGLLHWEKNLDSVATGFEDADHAATILIKMALVYVNIVGTLKVLSPIRHHMLDRHPPNKEHILQLEAYYIDMISNHATVNYGPDLIESMEILLPENGNITAVLKSALEDHPSESLAIVGYNMASFLGKVQPSTDLLAIVQASLDSLNLANIQTECLQLRGEILYRLCQWEQSAKEIEEAYNTFTEIGDQLRAAQCLRSLGDMLCMQSRYTEAQEKLEEANNRFTQIGDQLGAAQCLQSLGNILYMQDRYTEAQEKLEVAHSRFTEIGDQLGISQCLESLDQIQVSLNGL